MSICVHYVGVRVVKACDFLSRDIISKWHNYDSLYVYFVLLAVIRALILIRLMGVIQSITHTQWEAELRANFGVSASTPLPSTPFKT